MTTGAPQLTHAFFKNKELNHFYIAIAIMTLGESMITLFVPIYLFRIGYSIPYIIFFYLIMSVAWPIFFYPGSKIVSKIGIKHSFLLSIPLIILYYFGLYFIKNNPILFFITPIIFTLSRIFYNFSYHLNFVIHSDRKNRGSEVSIISIISIAVSVIAPLIGAIIATRGFVYLYIAASVIMILGTIPLFLSKEQRIPIDFSAKDILRGIFSKENRNTILSFSGYAIESSIGGIIWPLFLIIILVTLEKTGLVIVASTALAILLFYLIGKIADRYDRIKIVKTGTMMHFFAWIFRIFVNSALTVFIVETYKNISQSVVQTSWSAHSYDLAAKKEYFKFIVSRELTYAIARIIVLPILILIFLFVKVPFTFAFLIGGLFTLGYALLQKE